ncbi:hypothetical protein [Streptomyces melanogenes]|uniref:hypothetical protein n=1 Tax=Streptomyces melanogenes TaxID=67326 RepID=UPI0037B0BC0C
MTESSISRRRVLTGSGALLGAALLTSIPGTTLLATPAYADSHGRTPTGEDIRKAFRRYHENQSRVRTGRTSPNGWEMEKVAGGGGTIWARPVPGTPVRDVTVRIGDVETVLVHVIRRFHYEIDELRQDDIAGWRSPGKVRKGLPEGNLASGTAIRIRAGHYPAGTRGGFFPEQQLVIRDILAELDGVVRWGGDDRKPDEALFYIDVKPGNGQLGKTADRLRIWQDTPGQGAGAPLDMTSASRRRAAERLEKFQSTAK